MTGHTDSGDMQPDTQDENSAVTLTPAAWLAELRTAALALTTAARHLQRVLVHAPTDPAAWAGALADVDAQRAVLAGLLAAEVPHD